MQTFRKAFTLAEILIALVLIGVLTAILLPVAFHAAPDENVMKFKKANNALATVIRELVTSDDYYQDGDLGIKANGTLIDGKHDGDITFFCRTFADVLNAKKVNCSEDSAAKGAIDLGVVNSSYSYYHDRNTYKQTIDAKCNSFQKDDIVTPDGVSYWEVAPNQTFGVGTTDGRYSQNSDNENYSESTVETTRFFGAHVDENGFPRIYKIFCIDIDGINKNEAPFGYAIRQDGKILPGERALDWIDKSIQKEND